MPVRRTVASHFYFESAAACRAAIDSYIEGYTPGLAAPSGRCAGGIVPHAGWMFSGQVAARVLATLTAHQDVDTFVLFGAVHRMLPRRAGAVYAEGTWASPAGDIQIDTELACHLLHHRDLIDHDPKPHELEHSLEVQVPMIQYFAPDARILPILVAPTADADRLGRVVAETLTSIDKRIVFVGSTDLTHYGPGYGFTPAGSGPEGLTWAKEVNDQRMIDLILAGRADKVVAEAAEHQNACGSGAIAATMAACRAAGAETGHVLCHTTSQEVAGALRGGKADAVGYVGIVFTEAA